MSVDTTKKAIAAAYASEVGKAFSHLVDGLGQAGNLEAERRIVTQRFEATLTLLQDAEARAIEAAGK